MATPAVTAAVGPAETAGSYQLINHGLDITAVSKTATAVKLGGDGTVSGGASGTWTHQGNNRISLTLTGSGTDGRLYQDDPRVTCQDWTSSVGSDGQPRAGFSWPRGMGGMGFPGGGGSSSSHWISGLNPPGCAAHINIVQTGPPPAGTVGVGSGGGYGGFYCFALSP